MLCVANGMCVEPIKIASILLFIVIQSNNNRVNTILHIPGNMYQLVKYISGNMYITSVKQVLPDYTD